MKPVAWIEHHKAGDNLTWEQEDHSYAKATPLYTDKPVACDLSLTFGNMCQCKKLDLFTADQLRAAKVAVLREAADWFAERHQNEYANPHDELRRMANELEKS